jgi:hypothetical protein
VYIVLPTLALNLLSALQTLPASRELQSNTGRGTLRSDLLRLDLSAETNNFDIVRIRPLLNAVLDKEPDNIILNKVYAAITESTPPPRSVSSFQQTPWLRSTSSFVNSTEHRKYVDEVLKEELGSMSVDNSGFFKAFFGEITADIKLAVKDVFAKCKEGDNPLYREDSGWRDWPEGAKEKDVLSWFAQLTSQLLEFNEDHHASSTPRRPLAQPHQPVRGSTAERKLDVGFVDDPNAGVDSKCHWSHILVARELKSNPSADIASKAWLDLGRYAREVLAA